MKNTKYEPYRDLSPKVYIVKCENSNCLAHFHRSVELIYILEGEMSININGNSTVAYKDEIVFVPEYDTHCIHPIVKTQSITLIIPYELLSDYKQLIQNKTVEYKLKDCEYNKKILVNLEHLIKCVEENDAQILVKGYINVILGQILSHYKLVEEKKNDKSDIIMQTIEYIEQNYKKSLTLANVATEFGYSHYYFSKLFNKYIGCSFNHYINTVRIKHMMEDIKDINSNITDLVFDYGFDSLSTFYRHFKVIYGVAPKSINKQKETIKK